MNDETLAQSSSSTRIIICDPRRLLRQSLAIWLHSQDDVEVAATISSIGELSAAEENLTRLRADVALFVFTGAIASPERDAQFARHRKTVSTKLPHLRFIAVVDDAHADTSLLQHGFQTLINASSGAAGVLRSLSVGASEPQQKIAEIAVADPGPLTLRETEVLQLIGHGCTMDLVAAELGISVSTVASHKERIFAKLGANNQAHAVARAIGMGLLNPLDIRGDTSRVSIDVHNRVAVQ